MTTITARATGRSLVSDDLFTRLTRRIVEDEGIDQQFAERIMDQALVFLKACAENHRTRLAPSKSVDIGWHVFVLHTRDYADFCERVAGRFIHHIPTDDETSRGQVARDTLVRTVRAIQSTGFAVDAELWPDVAGKLSARCSPCHNGCADDPPPEYR
ncbi:MAG: glycine-rich domain-containing protein [Pseudonocardiaceae bacterium]